MTTFEIGEIAFIDSEHLAGFHTTFQEKCYECAREARLLKAKRTVDSRWSDLYPDNSRNQHALSHLDDFLLNRDDLS